MEALYNIPLLHFPLLCRLVRVRGALRWRVLVGRRDHQFRGGWALVRARVRRGEVSSSARTHLFV